MRKAILTMLLAGLSGSAAAEWVAVGGAESDALYADPATIRKDKAGNKVRMWSLLDLKKAGVMKGKPYMSIREQFEYDCNKQQSRLLSISAHSGKMGEGDTVDSTARPGQWGSITSGSTSGSLWKIACEKR